MNIREQSEQIEKQILSPYAQLSSKSKGRTIEEPQCPMRTVYQRDRDRILHSKAFRRLKQKTQVFIEMDGDHFRTRMTHTIEVMQIARTIARALRLNEDLTEAIAYGHDIGHTPFGHAGERILAKLCPEGFEHNKQSLRVVEHLEDNGKGLNLTLETLDGILNHRTSSVPDSAEGGAVRLADKIAYINHDIDDAIRAGIIEEKDLPADCIQILGSSKSARINTMIMSTVQNTQGFDVKMGQSIFEATYRLRDFLFDHVYYADYALEQEKKVAKMLSLLFEYFVNLENSMPKEFEEIASAENRERAVCDYIAGMTDDYAIMTFDSIFVPGRVAW